MQGNLIFSDISGDLKPLEKSFFSLIKTTGIACGPFLKVILDYWISLLPPNA